MYIPSDSWKFESFMLSNAVALSYLVTYSSASHISCLLGMNALLTGYLICYSGWSYSLINSWYSYSSCIWSVIRIRSSFLISLAISCFHYLLEIMNDSPGITNVVFLLIFVSWAILSYIIFV